MVNMKLYPDENLRLEALIAGHGNRKGSGIFPAVRNSPQITAEQLREVKKYQGLGLKNKAIRTELGLSEYIIRMALRGHYDHILAKG